MASHLILLLALEEEGGTAGGCSVSDVILLMGKGDILPCILCLFPCDGVMGVGRRHV